jgi:hypothetical protein
MVFFDTLSFLSFLVLTTFVPQLFVIRILFIILLFMGCC